MFGGFVKQADDIHIHPQSKLEIFDSKTSTSAVGIRKIASVDTTSKASLHFDIVLTSGMAIYNQGTTPADITINYDEK